MARSSANSAKRSVIMTERPGLLVLHATAVERRGNAIGFAGGTGAGKSTTAEALRRRGCRMVCDNNLMIRFESGRPWALPGLRRQRLLPKTLRFFGEDPAAFEPIWSRCRKRTVLRPEHFTDGKSPLKVLYFLKKGRRFSIKRLAPAMALKCLIAHSQVSPASMDKKRLSDHFRRCARLAASVPMAEVTRSNRIEELPSMAAALLKENRKDEIRR